MRWSNPEGAQEREALEQLQLQEFHRHNCAEHRNRLVAGKGRVSAPVPTQLLKQLVLARPRT